MKNKKENKNVIKVKRVVSGELGFGVGGWREAAKTQRTTSGK